VGSPPGAAPSREPSRQAAESRRAEPNRKATVPTQKPNDRQRNPPGEPLPVPRPPFPLPQGNVRSFSETKSLRRAESLRPRRRWGTPSQSRRAVPLARREPSSKEPFGLPGKRESRRATVHPPGKPGASPVRFPGARPTSRAGSLPRCFAADRPGSDGEPSRVCLWGASPVVSRSLPPLRRERAVPSDRAAPRNEPQRETSPGLVLVLALPPRFFLPGKAIPRRFEGKKNPPSLFDKGAEVAAGRAAVPTL